MSQIKGEARSLSQEDCSMTQNVSSILLAGGSFRTMEEVSKTLQLTDKMNPLIADCFAFRALIKTPSIEAGSSGSLQLERKSTTLFVVAVKTPHWNLKT